MWCGFLRFDAIITAQCFLWCYFLCDCFFITATLLYHINVEMSIANMDKTRKDYYVYKK